MPLSRSILFSSLFSAAFLSAQSFATADEPAAFPELFNTQSETPLTAREALAQWKLPEGFKATLFAGEPDVQQPIAIATDERGRMWVAENYTYAESAVGFEKKVRDRIVILEDTDSDGEADVRKVFWDKGDKLTSVEIGQGGVWALCAPNLVFIPDRNRDDIPDGEAEIVLDGWNDGAVRHNIVNGLRWGPDGWLYGRHGILATSEIGPPGSPSSERTSINCGVWRYHPTRKIFEAVAHGTTNPWGFDYDENGQMFFINTVIGHLWHIVPGAHYRRMYGVDLNPHVYGLLEQTADHFHWDTKEAWSDIRKLGVTDTTSAAGGGHAHSGLMIYLGDNWPDEYRNNVFTVNFHGKRLNRDTLERNGSTYVAKHAPDFAKTGDMWFRGIDLLYGPDGGVYVADWSDVGECHDNDGIHRTSGRIYKIVYGQPRKIEPFDLAAKTDDELIDLQSHKNDWYVRQARRVLQDRSASGADMSGLHVKLKERFANESDPQRKLRLMWCLFVSGGSDESWLGNRLRDDNEHVAAWALRLLCDANTTGESSKQLAEAISTAAGHDSALVRLFAASGCHRLEHAHRWGVFPELATGNPGSGAASDAMLPLMIWYAMEPAVEQHSRQAVDLAWHSSIPLLRQYVARRLTEKIETQPDAVESIVNIVVRTPEDAVRRDILQGMNEALDGWRKAPTPKGWSNVTNRIKIASPETQDLVRKLSIVFGDGRALDEVRAIALAADNDAGARRNAVRILAESGDKSLLPLMKQLLDDRIVATEAIRGLASFDDPEIPTLILNRWGNMPPEGRERAIDSLSARPEFAKALLAAVRDKRVAAGDLSASNARQIRAFGDEALTRDLEELWGVLRDSPDDKKKQIAALKSELHGKEIAQAELSAGRAVFQKACANCHILYGEGGKIGPDLTGANRQNLDYLLENIVDPSATMASNYKVSLLEMADGRVLTGVVLQQNERTLVLQTKDEKLTLDRQEIDSINPQNASLMPEGLLSTLSPEQIAHLIGYLQSGK